jgi:hypothetical protein
LTQRLYAGEEYTLQIDSHMRFTRHWDETLIRMLRQLVDECGIPKPILTAYPHGYEPRKKLDVSRVPPPAPHGV